MQMDSSGQSHRCLTTMSGELRPLACKPACWASFLFWSASQHRQSLPDPLLRRRPVARRPRPASRPAGEWRTLARKNQRSTACTAPSPLAGLLRPAPLSSKTSPNKRASLPGITRLVLKTNVSCSRPKGRASVCWTTTTTAGSISISSTAQPTTHLTAKPLRRTPRSFTTTTTARSLKSRKRPASPMTAGASAARSATTTTTAGPTSMSPTTARTAFTAITTTAPSLT